MTGQQEQILIKNIVAGDAQAFSVLVNAYKEAVIHLSYNILLNQQDAEEVAQDAFVKAFASLASFKAEARFSTWLYRIVVNTALNKKKLQKHKLVAIAKVSEELLLDSNNVLASQSTNEHRKFIQAALQILNVNERLCLTLYYLNELSVQQIRDLTDLSLSHIKVLLYRGRKNLYAELNKQLKGEIINLI